MVIAHLEDLDGYTLTGTIEAVDSEILALTANAPEDPHRPRSVYLTKEKARQLAVALSDWADEGENIDLNEVVRFRA